MQKMTMQEIGMTLTEFREWISGKSIAVVGNSLGSLDKDQGEQIDSHDLTLRFGKGTPAPFNFEKIGTRTDLWVTGVLRADRRKFLSPNTITLWNNSLYNPETQGPKCIEPLVDMFTREQIHYLEDEFGLPGNKRLSAGAIASLWLTRVAYDWDSLTFYNFDCFTSHTAVYNHLAEENSIVSSWHLPLLKPAYSTMDWREGNPAHHSPTEVKVFKEVLKKTGTVWKSKPFTENHEWVEGSTVEWSSGRSPARY